MAYQEDFNCEKEERQKSDKDVQNYEKKLQEANTVIKSMSIEVCQYKEYLACMSDEKQRVLGELRRLSESSYFAPSANFALPSANFHHHLPVRRNVSYPFPTVECVSLQYQFFLLLFESTKYMLICFSWVNKA